MPRRKKAVWEQVPDFTESELRYDPEEFYVPAHDVNGHSVRETIRIMPQMASELELIVLQFGKLCGWKTKGEFIRWAINRGIHLLHALEPSMQKTYLGAIMAQTEILTQDKHVSETEQLFHMLFERIEYHLARGEQGEAIKAMKSTKESMLRTPDTAWRRRWIERFDRQYGPWLRPSLVIQAPLELGPGPQEPSRRRTDPPDEESLEEDEQ